MKKMILIFLLVFFVVGCSNQAEEAIGASSKKEFTISTDEVINENLKVSLHKSFNIKDTRVYSFQKTSFPVSKEWCQGFVGKYMSSEAAEGLSEDLEYKDNWGIRRVSAKGNSYSVNVLDTSVFWYLDENFYNNSDLYYRKAYSLDFFSEDMELFYTQEDLSFMTYEEAKQMCQNILDELNYTYSNEACKGYSLSIENMKKYKNEHKEYFYEKKEFFKEVNYEYFETTEELGEFYVFYYPMYIKDADAMIDRISTVCYAEILINEDGVAKLYVPSMLEVVGEETCEIITPDIVTEKIIKMYDSVILTDTIEIINLELCYSEVAMENLYKTELDVAYVMRPCWKFTVEIGNGLTGYVYYDAVTGEQL